MPCLKCQELENVTSKQQTMLQQYKTQLEMSVNSLAIALATIKIYEDNLRAINLKYASELNSDPGIYRELFTKR